MWSNVSLAVVDQSCPEAESGQGWWTEETTNQNQEAGQNRADHPSDGQRTNGNAQILCTARWK